MLTKDALFSHSVNRPVYGEEKYILQLLSSRDVLAHNAALAVWVKKEDINTIMGGGFAQDPLGQPLVRVREGAFSPDRIDYFLHNNVKYEVGARGVLSKKVVVNVS